ncbi:conotoxin domain-containing protein [Pochonia chlamydosporia 170]|uniref:Conotoxin domain-containing protein n=1 Tax=Pochonia chlamydosporia 170 TaxID=1380566 RepID=A0A179FPM1_METCM|nr:conotoxin domain-containing protein [Pochonia chlamydosporia 170]OAQ67228.1 conotoxin domain-containing protein [Pochonia chlamydosporia 170]
MKFAFAIIAAIAGLAIANPVAEPVNNDLADNLLEKRCKGGDDHCSRDDECCSHKCTHRYASVYRCDY